jgi:hypothetical protein
MLSHCANSECGRPFLQLGQGKLFLVEAEQNKKLEKHRRPLSSRVRSKPRQVERYWLCGLCLQLWTLVQEPNLGIVLVPIRQPLDGAIAPGFMPPGGAGNGAPYP